MTNLNNDGTSFDGLTALVTGGNAGIGRAACHAFLERGARVIAVGLEKCDTSDPNLESWAVDLSVPGEISNLVLEISARGNIDILINNAGIVRTTLLQDVDDGEFDLMTNLHVRTAIKLAQACLPGMKQRRFGRIVNISSRAIVGLKGRTVYGATKAALVTMTRTWAMELGEFGITVNAVAPGPTATGMLTKDIPAGSDMARTLAASLPIGRLGTPEDIAHAVTFFADPRSSWITGQNLFVCGGGSLGSSAAL
jgi:3-oxoacyl-[acyl-carrier protein] reductase